MKDWSSELEQRARREAIVLEQPYIRTEHLLLALIQMDATILPISYEQLFEAISRLVKPACGAEQKLILAAGAKRALECAKNVVGDEFSATVIRDHLMQASPLLRRILNELQEGNHATSD